MFFYREGGENKEIKTLIYKAIKVLYVYDQKYELNEIFTQEYLNEFSKKLLPNENEKQIWYFVDDSFMQSLYKTDVNNAKVTVWVFEKRNHRILIIYLTKSSDDSWLVSNIEVDV